MNFWRWPSAPPTEVKELSAMSMDYKELKDALMEFFGDTSRTPGQTKSGLLAIIDEAQMLADTIDEDSEAED